MGMLSTKYFWETYGIGNLSYKYVYKNLNFCLILIGYVKFHELGKYTYIYIYYSCT